MSIEHLNDSNFNEVISGANKPVLVDFFATWCGPCKMIAPILEEVAEENEDFIIYKVDVDEAQATAQKFGVLNIPTLISFENGEVKNKNVGALQKDGILDFMS
ncbi:MAG: thioredoxin [Lachnospirales bacterium]